MTGRAAMPIADADTPSSTARYLRYSRHFGTKIDGTAPLASFHILELGDIAPTVRQPSLLVRLEADQPPPIRPLRGLSLDWARVLQWR